MPEEFDTFDLNEWRSKGEAAYSRLCAQEQELASNLSAVREEKEALAKVLGRVSLPKRVRLRPAIVALLEKSDGKIPITAIFKSFPDVGPDKVRAAIQRLAKDCGDVSIDDKDIVCYVKQPPVKTS